MNDLAAAVIIEHDRMLVIQNSEEKGGKIGPPGGKVETGENPRKCAIRECDEELGIIVVPYQKIRVYRTIVPTGETIDVHMFLSFIDLGAPVNLERAKISRKGWLTYPELEYFAQGNKLVPNLKYALKEIKKYFSSEYGARNISA